MNKYPRNARLECPSCNGKGYVDVTSYHGFRYNTKYAALRNDIRKMGKKAVYDMTLRQLAAKLGLKNNSAQSAKHHLSQVEKMGWDLE